jgi:hypothetical protein
MLQYTGYGSGIEVGTQAWVDAMAQTTTSLGLALV